uniref:Predicted protein n=1 Tax=Hordeum vulgare subsp. vulgare TaxID=112509 RepID=F2DU62_HORVV|nr:predicted protein [Hordeum vulgare subsp. vulgare]
MTAWSISAKMTTCVLEGPMIEFRLPSYLMIGQPFRRRFLQELSATSIP